MGVAHDSGSTFAGSGRWHSADVPHMWSMLRDHDHVPHHAALEGWRHAYELILAHRTQIEAYKAKLVQAWPPERSSASQAYVTRLDSLIANLTNTYEAAIANYTTYSSAINAVSAAKAEMKYIQEEYAKNAALIAEYETAKADAKQSVGIAEAGMIAPPTPENPVADGRQQELQQRAARIMTSVSAELSAAKFSLVTPEPFTNPSSPVRGGDTPIGGGGGGRGGRSGSSSALSSSRTASTGRPADSIIREPIDTSINGPDRGNINGPDGGNIGKYEPPDSSSDGPMLGGTKPDPTGPVTTLPTNTNPVTSTPNTNTNTSNPYTFTPGGTPTSTLPRGGHGPFSPTIGRSTGTTPGSGPGAFGIRGDINPHAWVIGAVPPGGTTSSGRGGTPVGGMPIGSAPPAGRSGQSGASSRAAQRVNPIGGMIGQNGITRPTQRQTHLGEEDERSRKWDPDNPWETDAGIDPVLLPPQERRIDPGPTIGGR